jgi:hypothetical protein
VEDGWLVVTASGRDERLQDVIDYGSAIIQLAAEHGVTRVMCDERCLEYALGTFDTYEAAQTIAERAPACHRVAIVCSPTSLSDGQFWETVAVNRDLRVRVDTDITRAREWLARED